MSKDDTVQLIELQTIDRSLGSPPNKAEFLWSWLFET